MEYRRFLLDIRKHFFTVGLTDLGNMLSRDLAETLSFKIFKSHLDMMQGSMLCVSLLG